MKEIYSEELCRTSLTEICKALHVEKLQGRRSVELHLLGDLRNWRFCKNFALGGPLVWKKVRIRYIYGTASAALSAAIVCNACTGSEQVSLEAVMSAQLPGSSYL